ncbi:thioredoxin-related transmembrane protein 1 [Arctopsyche grandis]|uniref:thioredoxin-related transmembrane protein 1 n=1 Tax=Arctopsyche grandis TaxID=121162 RepID=UPI00406D8488
MWCGNRSRVLIFSRSAGAGAAVMKLPLIVSLCLVAVVWQTTLATAALAPSKVVKLDETNWTLTLNDEWMLEFMAPWCPACTSLKGTWDDLGSSAKVLKINVAEIDVTTAPGLSGRFLVTALPTIYHVINGEFRQYKGPRDHDSLFTFVEGKRWKATEPVSWWKNPDSIQMSYVSYFFKMSQMLRVVHNILLEQYGLPTWGSYLVFALATILLGSIIGLLMVACIDFLYPQKATDKRPQPSPITKSEEAEVMNDDLIDEEEDNSEEYETQDDKDEDEEKNSASDTPESDSEEENKEIENSGSGASDKDNKSSPNVRRRKTVRKEK